MLVVFTCWAVIFPASALEIDRLVGFKQRLISDVFGVILLLFWRLSFQSRGKDGHTSSSSLLSFVKDLSWLIVTFPDDDWWNTLLKVGFNRALTLLK